MKVQGLDIGALIIGIAVLGYIRMLQALNPGERGVYTTKPRPLNRKPQAPKALNPKNRKLGPNPLSPNTETPNF